MKKIHFVAIFSFSALTLFSGCATQTTNQPIAAASQCFESKDHDYSEVLACYRQAHEKQPLIYTKKGSAKVDGIEKRTYELTSQTWMPESVTPAEWRHTVDIYVPDNALKSRALLIVNNGTNIGNGKDLPKAPTDFSDETLRSIASKTKTITISVSDVPNQYLQYKNSPTPKREDDSVAYTWKLFLDAPDKKVFSSLHIPMMEAVVKTMDLAEKEVRINRFIVSGASKRAWATWLAALADTRVDAIVPFVIDILNTKKVLAHEYATYGKGWPMAFKPYLNEGITEKLDTPAFADLMEIEDPMQYLDDGHADRLSIPKYIVNASGDDFFVPDNAQFYYDELPGSKMLRVAPNSSHYGITKFTESSLVPFVNRFQKAIPFPILTSHISTSGKKTNLRVMFSEKPVEIKQWTATNSTARDFRFTCGIKYVEHALKPESNGEVVTTIQQPVRGWTASFVEARFNDGLVVTSQVHITPDEVYPAQPDPSSIPACHIIR
jgi:PhoPQ-activated pathogenicity-related protein